MLMSVSFAHGSKSLFQDEVNFADIVRGTRFTNL